MEDLPRVLLEIGGCVSVQDAHVMYDVGPVFPEVPDEKVPLLSRFLHCM